MDMKSIINWARSYMLAQNEAPHGQGYRYRHGLRVARLSLALAARRDQPYHRQLLYLGGLLHDIGRAGSDDSGHGPHGAFLVAAHAAEWMSRDQLHLLQEIIRNHYQRRNHPRFGHLAQEEQSYEAMLVQDADILDHYGSGGVWSQFRWAVHEGLDESQALLANEARSAWHSESLQALNFLESRQELLARLLQQRQFYDLWAREQRGFFISDLSERKDETDE